MLKIKSVRLAVAFLLSLSSLVARSGVVDGLEMLSQNYHIYSQWVPNYTWIPPEGGGPPQAYPLGDWSAGYPVLPSGQITGGYDISSSDGTPVMASTIAPSPIPSRTFLSANASIDRFSFYNYAQSSAWHSEGAPLGGTLSFSGEIQTTCSAIWDFRPVTTQLNVHIAGGFNNEYGSDYSHLSITLQDMTSSATLVSIVNPYLPNPIYHGIDCTFTVDPTHTYEFEIEGWSNTFDSDWAYESVSAAIAAVPEPSALTMGALLVGMFGLRNIMRLPGRRRS